MNRGLLEQHQCYGREQEGCVHVRSQASIAENANGIRAKHGEKDGQTQAHGSDTAFLFFSLVGEEVSQKKSIFVLYFPTTVCGMCGERASMLLLTLVLLDGVCVVEGIPEMWANERRAQTVRQDFK